MMQLKFEVNQLLLDLDVFLIIAGLIVIVFSFAWYIIFHSE